MVLQTWILVPKSIHHVLWLPFFITNKAKKLPFFTSQFLNFGKSFFMRPFFSLQEKHLDFYFIIGLAYFPSD